MPNKIPKPYGILVPTKKLLKELKEAQFRHSRQCADPNICVSFELIRLIPCVHCFKLFLTIFGGKNKRKTTDRLFPELKGNNYFGICDSCGKLGFNY